MNNTAFGRRELDIEHGVEQLENNFLGCACNIGTPNGKFDDVRRLKNYKVAVYAAVPAVLVLVAVVVIAILCKRRRHVSCNKEGTAEYRETEPSRGSTSNAGVSYQNIDVNNIIDGVIALQDYQDLNPQYQNTPTHEYSTIAHEVLLGGISEHEYQDLNPQYELAPTYEYSTIGKEAHLDDSPQQAYQDLYPENQMSQTNEYSTENQYVAQLDENR